VKTLFIIDPEETQSLAVLKGLNNRASHSDSDKYQITHLEPPAANALPWEFEPPLPFNEIDHFDRISAATTVGAAHSAHAESSLIYSSAFLYGAPLALLAFVLCCPLRRMGSGLLSTFKTGLTMYSVRNETSDEHAALAQLIVDDNIKTPRLRE
jgi:hypothetical protein